MSLRGKLLLAQLPLALALLAVGLLSVHRTRELSERAQAILRDNHQSVLACQAMKESLERVEGAAALIALGERARGERLRDEHLPRFERALAGERANVTEVGEPAAAAELASRWATYAQAVQQLRTADDLARLEPAFAQVNEALQAVLDLNQEAMVRKSDDASQSAQRSDLLLALATALALGVGGLSTVFTSRLLRPLSVLTQAARRIGQGDLEARAVVDGRDEVAGLAREFNEMAARLRQYRQSTLGELLQAQSAAQSAIDSLPDAVVIFGTTGEVLAENALAEGERSREEPALQAALQKAKAHVLAGRGPYVPQGFEEAIRVGDRYLLARATPVQDPSGLHGATVVLQDVTRLRRFDELKDDLVATVAHEFRTPLTSLRMAIHLCLEGAAGALTEKQKDLLQAGRDDCERLQGVVDDLLDLSRLQARDGAPKQVLAASAFLGLAADQSRALAAERGVVLELDDLSEGASFMGESERLLLVASNLVTNAIRYTPAGQAVTLRARATGSAVRFEVVDPGPGIAPEFRERIFEKHFRVPGSPEGGTGLGLYIARGVVAANGGDLGVESEVGRGSTFWFTVPRRG